MDCPFSPLHIASLSLLGWWHCRRGLLASPHCLGYHSHGLSHSRQPATVQSQSTGQESRACALMAAWLGRTWVCSRCEITATVGNRRTLRILKHSENFEGGQSQRPGVSRREKHLRWQVARALWGTPPLSCLFCLK